MELLNNLLLWANPALVLSFLLHSLFRSSATTADSRTFLVFWRYTWLAWFLGLLLWQTFFILALEILFTISSGTLLLASVAAKRQRRDLAISTYGSRKEYWLWTWVTVLVVAGQLLYSADRFNRGRSDEGLVLEATIALHSYLAMAYFSGRYEAAGPFSRNWVTATLYLYAALQVVYMPLSHSNLSDRYQLSLATFYLSIPLKVVLYYAGYSLLLYWNTTESVEKDPKNRGNQEAKSSEDPAALDQDASPGQAQVDIPNFRGGTPPDPTVQIQLSGLWGFLYLSLRYSSGRLLIVMLIFSLVSGAIFLGRNASELVTVLREATKSWLNAGG